MSANLGNSGPKDKLLSFYRLCKIVVSDFKELKSGKLICSCYTPDVPSDLERQHIILNVTEQEIQDYVHSKPSLVTKEVYSFGEWYADVSDDQLKEYLQDIIDKREKRILVWNADLQDLYNNVKLNGQLTEANNDIDLLRSLIFKK